MNTPEFATVKLVLVLDQGDGADPVEAVLGTQTFQTRAWPGDGWNLYGLPGAIDRAVEQATTNRDKWGADGLQQSIEAKHGD